MTNVTSIYPFICLPLTVSVWSVCGKNMLLYVSGFVCQYESSHYYYINCTVLKQADKTPIIVYMLM